MDGLYEQIISVIESAILSREDRILSAFHAFQKDIKVELALLQQLIKTSVPVFNDISVKKNNSLAVTATSCILSKCVEDLPVQKKIANSGERFENSDIIQASQQITELVEQSQENHQEKDAFAPKSSVIKTEVFEDLNSRWLLPENVSLSPKDQELITGKETADIVNVSAFVETASPTDNQTLRSDELETMFVDVYDANKQLPVVMETEKEDKTNGLIVNIPQDTRKMPENKKFQCEVCDKYFVKKGTLRDHMNIHTKEKQYKCLICGKLFHRKRSIREHVKLHHAGKKHKCEHCGKKFATKNTLNRHVMIHTGEKPYQCKSCLKRFARKGYLKIHSERYCGKKPYTADRSLETNWIEFSSNSDFVPEIVD